MNSRPVIKGEIADHGTKATTTSKHINPSVPTINPILRENTPPPHGVLSKSSSRSAGYNYSGYRSRSPYRDDQSIRGREGGYSRDGTKSSDSRHSQTRYESRHESAYNNPGSRHSYKDYDREARREKYRSSSRRDEHEEPRGHMRKDRHDEKDFSSGKDGRHNERDPNQSRSYGDESENRRGYKRDLRYDDLDDRDSNRHKRQRTEDRSRSPAGRRSNPRDIAFVQRGANEPYVATHDSKTDSAPRNPATHLPGTRAVDPHPYSFQRFSKYEKNSFRDRFDNISCAPLPDSGASKPETGTLLDVEKPKEELSAEERRRRRALIKAKYAAGNEADTTSGTSASPAIMTGIQTSRSVTPGTAPAAAGSTGISTPLSSRNKSATQHDSNSEHERQSKFMYSQLDGTGDERDSPPYEIPQMDGPSDVREVNHENIKEVSAISYDENDEKQKKVIISNPATNETGTSTITSDDDIFGVASEVADDNMFAPVGPALSKVQDLGNKSAKTLDQSLLDNWDDPEGYYRVIPGEILDGKYHVRELLGKGVFANVVGATDTMNDQPVAIKIVRTVEVMTKAAEKEIDYLQRLALADPDGKKHIIKLERSFTHKGHLCMVFEQLSNNLRDVLRKFGRDVGINLKAVRSYAQQMFLGLQLLEKCNIVHMDLKPDNILVDGSRSMLKLCDLGSAGDIFDCNKISDELVSRFYRPPEIMLGMSWGFPVDMWSIGCTLYELYTGKILFAGRDNNQMLRSIMECRGKFSLKMLKKGELSGNHFDDQTLDFMNKETDRANPTITTVKLLKIMKPSKDLKERLVAAAQATSKYGKLDDAEMKELSMFADLLDKCLALNPEKRIKPSEALKHEFIHRPGRSFGFGFGRGSSKA